MFMTSDQLAAPAAIRIDLGAIFVSLELSKSTWLVTSLSPGSEKMSRYTMTGGDMSALLSCLNGLREKAEAREDKLYSLVVIQEAGLDGFWIHRALEQEDWIESHVVDAASIAVSRRRRRAKTDRIDGETLVRTLMAWKRGEPRVCSMVHVPTSEEEDRRRLSRERKALAIERGLHINRIKAPVHYWEQIYGRIGSPGMGRFRSQRVDPKGQKSVLVELGIVGEHIISGQIDVIPAQRGDLPQ